MNEDTITRPLDDDGTLLASCPEALAPSEVLKQGLATLTGHLEHVVWWPKADCGTTWQIGDFSFYVLEFPVGAAALLYAQVWSEPGEGVLVEVSSGAWSPPTGDHVSAAQRDALLNRGFETGGQASNYRKVIQVEKRSDCRKLARELLSVLTECLGYDGTMELTYKLHLGRRTQTAQVFESLTFDDFGRLLKSWGFAMETIDDNNRRSYRSTAGFPFVATLQNENDDRPGEFDGFTLSTFATLPPGVIGPVEEELRRELPFAQASIDDDGDLVVSQLVYLGGGVTDAHLRHLMDFWRAAQQLAHTVIQKHREEVDTHVLN